MTITDRLIQKAQDMGAEKLPVDILAELDDLGILFLPDYPNPDNEEANIAAKS